MIAGFNVKDVALGTGDTDTYTFDFRIYALTDLKILVTNAAGDIQKDIRGDDTEFLAGVTFDENGGTVTLAADLADGWIMTFILAPDLPAQPTSFPNKSSFTFEALEGALDFLASCIQRAAYLAQRAMVMHDLDDIDGFDPTLPKGLSANPGGIISINDEGSGFEIKTTAAALLGIASTGFYVSGSPGTPLDISAAGGLSLYSAAWETQYVRGNGTAVTVSASPPIPTSSATAVGKIVILVGTSNSNTLTLQTGTGLSLKSDCTLALDSVLAVMFNGSYWSEIFRST